MKKFIFGILVWVCPVFADQAEELFHQTQAVLVGLVEGANVAEANGFDFFKIVSITINVDGTDMIFIPSLTPEELTRTFDFTIDTNDYRVLGFPEKPDEFAIDRIKLAPIIADIEAKDPGSIIFPE